MVLYYIEFHFKKYIIANQTSRAFVFNLNFFLKYQKISELNFSLIFHYFCFSEVYINLINSCSPGWISVHPTCQRVALLEVLWVAKGLHSPQVSLIPLQIRIIYNMYTKYTINNIIVWSKNYIVHRFLRLLFRLRLVKISLDKAHTWVCLFYQMICFCKKYPIFKEFFYSKTFAVSPQCLIPVTFVRRWTRFDHIIEYFKHWI